MRSTLFAGLVIFSAGMTVGSILQWFQNHKTIETQRYNYNKLADSYNEKNAKLMSTIADLETARVLNTQVATYACSLKKSLDQFMQ